MEETNKNKKFHLFAIVFGVLLGINIVLSGVLLGLHIHSQNQSDKEIATLKEEVSALKGNDETKTKYTLYIGTNDKDTYTNVIPFDDCISKVTQICTKYTDGCTIYEATGYWKDEKSNITTEKTIACILEDITAEKVYKICDEVIVELNQNSILIETSNVITTFYSTKKGS
jgi:hypothetical protein